MTQPLRTLALLGGLGLLVATSVGCRPDNGFTLRRDGTIGVVIGDFDNIQETFNRQEIDTVRYDGIISTATWVEDADAFQPPGLSVEGLFVSERNQELLNHSVVFVSSGARGLGERQYNSLQPDDHIISDDEAVENAAAFVRGGGVLFATDWAYDLVARAFPATIDFLGDDMALDAAQRGDIGRVQAKVIDEDLRTALGLDEAGGLVIDMSFGNWAVMEGVNTEDDRVKVWMTGNVTYRDEDGEGTQTLEDVPLLVTVDSGGDFNGRLVYTSFHLDAQNPAFVDTLLQVVVGDLNLTTVVTDPGVQE